MSHREADVLREILLPKLEGVRFSGGSWMARCPAHEDGKASLHISRGDRQPVVLTCHAGCQPEEILGALGFTWETLCTPKDAAPVRGEWTPHGVAMAVYDYADETGTLLFQVCRTADKQFSQRVPDHSRKSGWRWQLGDTRRVLYRLPKVLEAIADGEMIWICEGEKDVHALEAAGCTATCNPGGAGKWRPEYSEIFRDVIAIIVADKDKPGQAHARQVAASLEGIAAAVEIREALTGKDAADHLAAGHQPGDMVVTKEAEAAAGVELAPDLHEFLGAFDQPILWVLPDLLERGDRLIWTGEEGRGKSMAVRQIAIAAAAGVHPFTDADCPPQRVLYIDCENAERKSRRHFRHLARVAEYKRHPVPRGGFRIIHRPEGIDLSREEESLWLAERVTAHQPDLLVIGPLYKLHALDINEEQSARTIVRVLDAVRIITGCAVVIEAHAPHGPEGSRALRPFGSSLFMRWPEFGYGIRIRIPDDKDEKPTRKHVEVKSWRGPRDEREWPRELVWGEEEFAWPWVDPNARPVPWLTPVRSDSA